MGEKSTASRRLPSYDMNEPGERKYSRKGSSTASLNFLVRSVTIKGSADQEAVLCTGKATFALKHVETTNTLYMVPSSDSSCQTDTGKVCVKATAAAHLEMSQMAPQLKDLDAVLQVRSSK